jgi:hypothetical protein
MAASSFKPASLIPVTSDEVRGAQFSDLPKGFTGYSRF